MFFFLFPVFLIPKHGDNEIKILAGPCLKWYLKLTDLDKKISYGSSNFSIFPHAQLFFF